MFVCPQVGDPHKIINEKGCLSAGEEWLERNLLVVAGIAVGIAFLQVRVFVVFFPLTFCNSFFFQFVLTGSFRCCLISL